MNTLNAQKRNMTEKAKKLRRDGYVTGNLFGKDLKGSVPLKILKKDAERINRTCLKGSQLLLTLEGTEYDVLIKEIDYNSMTREILEMDFQALVKGEKVHSTAEIILHNKEMVQQGIAEQLLSEIAYKAFPEDIVDRVTVDCSSLHLGDTLRVADLELAKNPKIEITTHPDTAVVTVAAVHAAHTDEEDTAAGENT